MPLFKRKLTVLTKIIMEVGLLILVGVLIVGVPKLKNFITIKSSEKYDIQIIQKEVRLTMGGYATITNFVNIDFKKNISKSFNEYSVWDIHNISIWENRNTVKLKKEIKLDDKKIDEVNALIKRIENNESSYFGPKIMDSEEFINTIGIGINPPGKKIVNAAVGDGIYYQIYVKNKKYSSINEAFLYKKSDTQIIESLF